MNQEVIFNNNNNTPNIQFERNNLIFSQFHNNNLIESFRSKQSTTKEDKRSSVNFNQHLMIQRSSLGHNFTNGQPQNIENEIIQPRDYSKQDNNEIIVPKLDKSLPPNIYHNFSASNRKTKRENGYDFHSRNFRVDYNRKSSR